MTTPYEIALAVYERIISVFAQRAGELVNPVATPDWSTQAEALALPGDRQTETGNLFALHSMVARLHEREQRESTGSVAKGRYRPALMQSTTPDKLETASIIPQVNEHDLGLSETYRSLWREFGRERQQLARMQQDSAVREANFLALIQRYCWAMPSPLVHRDEVRIDDVSLYDYVRVSAALAVCLAQRDSGEQVALLIGGDVSGVQEWLYTLTSSGAARSLRGRSFYLQLLSEVIALYLLRELDLPSCNLLYAGGGNFYLLAPASCANRIRELQAKITHRLIDMHDGALYVALGHAPLTEQLLTDGRTGEAWKTVAEVINRVKARRFAELDAESMAQVIGSAQPGDGEPDNTCVICRRIIAKGEQNTGRVTNPQTGEDEGRKCGLCASFEQLGKELPNAEFLVIADVEPATPSRVNRWEDGLRQFGFEVQLLKPTEQETNAHELPRTGAIRIFYWRDERPDPAYFPGNPPAARTVWAFRPLAQAAPLLGEGSQQHVADFGELDSRGIQRWGVLRMDVDDLGRIFQSGIPASSLCHLVSLSGLLRLFFEGYVPALAQHTNQKLKQSNKNPGLYLMYAGGDDLFVVGGWSHLPLLAHEIQQALGRFACGNQYVTISGGISIALAEKYPLYQAAEDAHVAETLAKENNKNSLALLGQTMTWDEYPLVYRRVTEWVGWLDAGKIPRGFLMILRSIDAEWREWRKRESGQVSAVQPRYQNHGRLFIGPWQWHLFYQLTRAAERTRDEDLKGAVRELVHSVIGGEIFTLGLAARWAELMTNTTK